MKLSQLFAAILMITGTLGAAAPLRPTEDVAALIKRQSQ